MEISDLKQIIRNVFDPIADRLGLTGPVERSFSSTEFHLAYLGPSIGVEIAVEMVDFFIYALIFRPQDNIIPMGYKDTDGRRQKLYLQDALKELSIDVTATTKALQKLGGDYRNCDEMARLLGQLLEQYWPFILSNEERWFNRTG